MGTQLTTEDYKNWINENRPDYEVLEDYVKAKTKIKHRHKPTGIEWFVSPDHFKRGKKPPELVGGIPHTHDDYVFWVKQNRPDYKVIGDYKNSRTPIKHEHIATKTQWKCSPLNFKKGKEPRGFKQTTPFKTLKQYEKELIERRPDVEVLEEYISARTPIQHRHKPSGIIWRVSPDNALRGKFPPSLESGYSIVAIEWIEGIMKAKDIFIRHAKNIGEYQIPGTRYTADGYHEDSNTIYEFYGDYWHGNPDVFKPTATNYNAGKTFKQLYSNTLRRETRIKNLGYNVISIWESDYMASLS